MTHPADSCPELEELAAFIDGRLRGDARREMVDHLDRCERCQEIFGETVRFREEERPAGAAVRHPAAAPGFWRWAVGGAVAAALAAAVLLPGILRTELPPADRIAGTLAGSGASPALAYDGAGWPLMRGESVAAGRERVSFRLGVRTVDLALALAAGDRERAAALAGELARRSAGLPLAAPVEISYAQLAERLAAGEPTAELAGAAAAAEGETALAGDPTWYRFGQWAEGGRLAALAGGDRRLLGERAWRRFPRQLEDELRAGELGAPLAAVETLLAEPQPPLPELAAAFDRLIAAAGG